ncbi:hypothetical protein CISG_03061 [Coccidioides immitis RMSCC 3703]|uniref:Uncharacterized protein n=2 Tax=Coccidioides immitis TaxID=5501 RepID=A0A0J8QMH2_COCIT|nr:hypothetical protein CIRG_08008 [Coccidioides immitis RMSCC 2394]KMU72413.1 hypothetical protein CISG_03061 [Coccidioides immitis RMSCC 3703]
MWRDFSRLWSWVWAVQVMEHERDPIGALVPVHSLTAEYALDRLNTGREPLQLQQPASNHAGSTPQEFTSNLRVILTSDVKIYQQSWLQLMCTRSSLVADFQALQSQYRLHKHSEKSLATVRLYCERKKRNGGNLAPTLKAFLRIP